MGVPFKEMDINDIGFSVGRKVQSDPKKMTSHGRSGGQKLPKKSDV